MKIEIDTDTDSYKIWKKVRELIEEVYQESSRQVGEMEKNSVKWGTGDPKLQG